MFVEETRAALGTTYPVVTQPGPGVARLRFTLIAVAETVPYVSTATRVIPIGAAVNLLKGGAVLQDGRYVGARAQDVGGRGLRVDRAQLVVVVGPEEGEGRRQRAGADPGHALEHGPGARGRPAAEQPSAARSSGRLVGPGLGGGILTPVGHGGQGLAHFAQSARRLAAAR
jgi:hypothetical protein